MKNRVVARLVEGKSSSANRRLFYGAAQRGGVTVISRAGEPWNPDLEPPDSPATPHNVQPEAGSNPLLKEQGQPS
jgi:hypothetical protein